MSVFFLLKVVWISERQIKKFDTNWILMQFWKWYFHNFGASLKATTVSRTNMELAKQLRNQKYQIEHNTRKPYKNYLYITKIAWRKASCEKFCHEELP